MNLEEHCKACMKKFGKEYKEVHRWLDFYFGKRGKDKEGEYDYTGVSLVKHREKRHHLEGIYECRKKFGDEAVEAAKFHIMQDFGFIPSRNDYYKKDFWEEYFISYVKGP